MVSPGVFSFPGVIYNSGTRKAYRVGEINFNKNIMKKRFLKISTVMGSFLALGTSVIAQSTWTAGTNLLYTSPETTTQVGIGTTTPSAKLSLYDASSAFGMNFQVGSNSKFWVSASSSTLSIGGIGSTIPSTGILNINSSGLAAIGTSPVSGKKFTVSGSSTRTTYQNSYIDLNNATASASLAFKIATASTYIGTLQWDGNAYNLSSSNTTLTSPLVNVSGKIKATDFVDANGVSIASKWTLNEDYSIISQYNVIIGTATALQPGQISDGYLMNVYGGGNPFGSTGKGILVRNFNGNSLIAQTYTGTAVYGQSRSYNNTYGYSGRFEGGYFSIARDESTSITTPDFYVGLDGNVSIGTTTIYGASASDPYKLSVNGKVACKELKVDVNWSDYVFEKNYKLRNLKEVESYIKENNHLPEVPSATEVESNGLKVGEMQATMMKKIEELTLYIIEQQKTMEKQQSMIENLQSEVSSLKE